LHVATQRGRRTNGVAAKGLCLPARNHFVLQPFWNSLNSSGANLSWRTPTSDRSLAVTFMLRSFLRGFFLLVAGTVAGAAVLFSGPAAVRASTPTPAAESTPVLSLSLDLPPSAREVIDQIYSGDLETALDGAHRLQQERPAHPLGYLLEAEALWWRIWCTSAEFKYGMTYPRHRAKLAADQRYLDLAAKISALAAAQAASISASASPAASAEARFYSGMGNALAARLYGLRGETRTSARYGVRAREDLLRAIALDPSLADADFGLGLYNYYADTLSAAARVLRFFMGIPGGNKQEGIRQLEQAFTEGALTPPAARFYLAINLHNYDQQYQRALDIAVPLVEKYPSNPIFQIILGDLYAKLGRTEPAAEHYRAAAALPIGDPECGAHIHDLARASLAAIGATADTGLSSTNPQ
jgi:tetratricopeptide (TPR) repeat protein